MKKFCVIAVLSAFVFGLSMCHKTEAFPDSGYDDRLSGGAATAFDISSNAFGNIINGLSARDEAVHVTGDNIFSTSFQSDPGRVFAGLGPIYNNTSCVNCHRSDGEGIPTAGLSNSGLLMRISQQGNDAHGGALGIDGFGTQIQDQALVGTLPEATVNINYTDLVVTYPDGTVTTLRQPAYALTNLYAALPSGYLLSPRLAPPLVGMGLLENIPETTILSFIDAADANGDGITGKANYVYDPYTKKTELGRFGLKANTPTLLIQVANAYQQDMGITSYVDTLESCYGQSQFSAVPGNGKKPELVDSLLNYVTFYVKTLAVPARRDVKDSSVTQGQALFNQINCSGCHRPTMQTGIDLSLPQISNQRIHPYTDLLVHNMGDGLADNRPDYLAGGTEWRTTPLWGIGLLTKTNGTPYYLHDGRARTLEEAILWHDGEAKNAKEKFMQLSSSERALLIRFLQSL